MKELGTGTILLRSNSHGDLYPLTSSTGATISSSSPSDFTTLSSTIWHSRLGHPPGDVILNSLRSSKIIDCNKTRLFCISLPLSKHIKLPFATSMSFSSCPFEIIHNNLWTSPICSPLGYKYYVLFLGDFDNNLFHTFCTKDRIVSRFLCPHTSQNRKFECKICSINNIIRTLLCHVSLPFTF